MSIYQKYYKDKFDNQGKLIDISVEYPDNFNFGYDVVDVIAKETPNKRALVWCNVEGEEHFFTFDDIRHLSNQAANVFLKAGIKKGDHVFVALKRHYEYWYVSIALHKIGAIMIPATHMLTVEDLVYRFESANVCGVVCTPNNDVPERVLETVKLTGKSCKLWSIQKDIDGFDNLSKAVENASGDLERQPVMAHDPMMLYFTSGTTGHPKGVIHDNTYPLAHIVTAKYWHRIGEEDLHFTVAETGWAKSSWGKLYGQWIVGSAIMVYDFDNFEPKQLVNVINRYGVTSFCAPPTIYRYLVRKNTPDMPTLRNATTAGEFLSLEVFREFTERTGLPLREGYGQTETTILTGNFYDDENLDGSLGKGSPLYNVQLRERDGSPTPDGEVGELVIAPKEDGKRPVGLFVGYLDNAEMFQDAWRDGVYHTGDAVWKDENGVYWFHGRFDDLIKSGGYRVGPYEIESVLNEHPAVVESSVIGVQDKLRGQAIKAVIVLAPGYEASHELEKEIREFCNSRLAEYKWVRIIEFVSEMPKTISGKIRKAEQRKN